MAVAFVLHRHDDSAWHFLLCNSGYECGAEARPQLYFRRLRTFSSTVRSRTESGSERIVGPVIRTGTEAAKVETTVQSLVRSPDERSPSQERVDES